MLEVRNLTKRFGKKVAVDDVSFSLEPGKVTGFVGPNGAGKTTTMRCILGLDRPTSGVALIDGEPYAKLKRPIEKVGAMIDAKAFHKSRSARNHLRILAVASGISSQRVDEVIEQVGLAEVAKKKAGSFSLGMGQRIGIAAALLGNPKILVLDEPVNGLDPEGVKWVREFCRSYASSGRTVLISSHLMSEVEQTVDNLLIIGKGKIIRSGTIGEILSSTSTNSVRVATADLNQLANVFNQLRMPFIYEPPTSAESASGSQGTLVVENSTPEQIGQVALNNNLLLTRIEPIVNSLEQAFMQLTEDAVEYHATQQVQVKEEVK
jgi:ABC-2 type transport system ATP-binding protein